MISSAVQRRSVATAAIACLALFAGFAAAAQPKPVLGLVAAGGLTLLTFQKPVLGLLLLLFLTCIVPYGIQNRLGVGGGEGSPGLLLSDLLLIAGLTVAVVKLAVQPVDRRGLLMAVAMLLFLGVVAVQFVHGVTAGHTLSRAGQECRVLLGFGTYLIVASVADDAAARRALMTGLVTLGLLLGLWGMLQWFGHISFGAAGDVGVREGVRLTSGGTGQLQGGEYGFPVVVVAFAAALLYHAPRTALARIALWVGIGLNAIACLVTFERSFWLSTFLGCAFVLVRAPVSQRIKFFFAAPVVAALAVVVLATLAPNTLTTAHERFLSLGQYSSDDSVRYRVVESKFVLDQIREHPLAGSGLAAEIFWGQPWGKVPPKTFTFTHNGYLWLAWKLGIPAAALLVLAIVLTVLMRAPPGEDRRAVGIRRGAQGALLALLLSTATFPSFSVLSITPAMGVLIALAVLPSRAGDAPARALRSRGYAKGQVASSAEPRPWAVHDAPPYPAWR